MSTQVMESANVVNLDTGEWSPAQIARWLQEKVDAGEVEDVYVITKSKVTADGGWDLIHTWSKTQPEDLWWLINWGWHKLQRKYFVMDE